MKKTTSLLSAFLILSLFLLNTSCTSEKTAQEVSTDWETVRDSSDIAFTIEGGLAGPEAVRYDPDQEVYFISNFNGGGNDEDANGFITRADKNGTITDLKFMQETGENPLHAPRGMFITGDELWVADVKGVHAFNRITGEQTAFVSFEDFDIGFLNDVSADEEGTLYITDTGTSQVFRIKDNTPSLFIDALPSAPNGITLNPQTKHFVLAPWGGDQTFYSFDSSGELDSLASMDGGNFDGIEYMEGYLISTSQQDSSVRIYNEQNNRILIHTTGRGADIGVDRANKRIAVPYIALNKVDVWELKD